MLKLAIQYKEQLDKLLQNIVFDDRFKFYINDSGPELTVKINDDCWKNLQFVSILNDRVIGLFEANINRQSNMVTGMAIINFTGKANLVFAKDFRQFFYDLFLKYDFNKVEWGVVVGNPAEIIYDKFVAKRGGRVVGVYRESNRLWDGKLYDYKMYEILKREFKI